MMRKPDFFIVGAPKCGTTAIHFLLRQHPEIFMPANKEPHFFGTDMNAPYFIRDEQKYLSLFAPSEDEKRVGEASVWYLYSKVAAAEIYNYCPSSDIIIMLRNPVDVMHSLHNQRVYNGFEDIEDFEKALEAENDRRQGMRIPERAKPIEGLYYREVPKYAQQVQRYLKVFDRERIHFIIYDDFRDDNARIYRGVCEFLGVEEGFEPVFRIVNVSKYVRSRKIFDFMSHPPYPIIWMSRMVLPKQFRVSLKNVIRVSNTRNAPRPDMDPKLRPRLQAEMRQEVEQLSQLLGRDLSHWSKDAIE